MPADPDWRSARNTRPPPRVAQTAQGLLSRGGVPGLTVVPEELGGVPSRPENGGSICDEAVYVPVLEGSSVPVLCD